MSGKVRQVRARNEAPESVVTSSPVAGDPLARRSRWTWIAAIGLLGVHGLLAITSLTVKSVTNDELTHLPAGLAAVQTGEVHLNPQHPPLVKLLAGLAASTAEPELPLDSPAYEEGKEWVFGREVFFGLGNDHEELLRRGRLPVVFLSMLGGLAVFLWSRRRFGDGGGLFSLTLFALSPTLLAHARLVTMDAAVAAGWTWTLYLWWRLTRKAPHHLRLAIACSIVLGLTLASKFSGLILLPALAMTALATAGPDSLRTDWRKFVALGLGLGLGALVVLQVVYLFDFDGSPLRYVRDLGLLYADRPEGHTHYLRGQFETGSYPHYFLVALGIKTALPGLLAMVAGLAIIAIDRRQRTEWRDNFYLWLPALLWLIVTTIFAENIGVRYVLPIYPLLFILAGSLVPTLARAAASARTGGAGRWLLLLPFAVGAAQAAESLSTHPDYLPYFNRLVGHAQGGIHWLDDSNLDWGQDLGRLPAWLEEKGIERVRLLYFGVGDPDQYGVPREPMQPSDWLTAPRPGDYVVSANALIRGVERARIDGSASDWLHRYEPSDILGGSLYLYRFAPAQTEIGTEAATVTAPAEGNTQEDQTDQTEDAQP